MNSYKQLFRLTHLTVLLSMSFGCGISPSADARHEQRERIEVEIREVDRRMKRAYAQNDLASYWSFYADDFIWVWNRRGWIALDEYKKEWTAFVDAGGGVIEIDTQGMRIVVDPGGSMAVVSSKYSARYRNPDGTERQTSYYETDVWARRADGWKIVYLHGSQ